VLAARLSDAKFFWENDLAIARAGMKQWTEALEKVTFQGHLGSQGERMRRVAALTREIAPVVGADPDRAEEAALIAKADLVSEMVYEFPELQGVMGVHYAEAAGHDPEVAAVAAEHYRPMGPGDAVPTAPLSVAVALADKIDTLTGFWAIDEKPTGSKDPYALRRAALGVIRLVLENGLRVGLVEVLRHSHLGLLISAFDGLSYPQQLYQRYSIEPDFQYPEQPWKHPPFKAAFDFDDLLSKGAEKIELALSRYEGLEPDQSSVDRQTFVEAREVFDRFAERLNAAQDFFCTLDFLLQPADKENVSYPFKLNAVLGEDYGRDVWSQMVAGQAPDLLTFLHDRLKVHFRDEGIRHDVIDAVLAMPGADDLVLVEKRARALNAFLATDDGENLVQGFRRANNILAQAEARDGVEYSYGGDAKFAETDEERALFAALETARAEIAPAMAAEDFEAAMHAMARLRAPIDAFFEAVQVNAEAEVVRRNRLNLLHEIREICGQVADLTRLEG